MNTTELADAIAAANDLPKSKAKDIVNSVFASIIEAAKRGDEVAIFPSGKAERRLRTKMREMTPPNWGRSLTSCMEGVSRYLTGWISHFRLCTPEAVQGLGILDAHVRRRVRAIIVRQKKRSRSSTDT